MGETAAYLSVRGLIAITALLPTSWVYSLMKAVALVFYYLSRSRREITKQNLAAAFPNKSRKEIEILAKEVYVELSKTVSEIFLMLSNRFPIDDAIINKEEALVKLASLKQLYPTGWIMITAHFSNWELLAQFLGKHDYSMVVIGREGDNKKIDSKITTPFRERFNNRSVHKRKAAVTIMKTLKKGGIVGILIDQKVMEHEGIKVKFFGRDVYATPLVATMKNKLDIQVIPMFLPRVSNGKYELLVGDPVEADDDIASMTQAYNDEMEKIIRKYPAQWFWMHNRWKV
ncbi:lysophospholipid acyltransferase family protein [Sulfurovum sp. NBC37-1]|uniref:lysophospholipid acyltransferase family protein n=1 Tax=Sulfurovum sp. (strain NBC37-1) TaxID=387093 RepID=UPI0002D3A733|nr:lysophospholipid acyltransferase family protein [Sulfurovum sp. NBC37-1]